MSLGADQLRAFVANLATDRDRIERFIADAEGDERAYELLWDDGEVNAWIIRWTEDSDTGFHDHDVSGAGITVLAGNVREDRLTVGGVPRRREFGPGETFVVEPSAIHRVLHTGEGAAVTIHAYSPPLRRTGAYRVGPDGVLERESQDYEVELVAA